MDCGWLWISMPTTIPTEEPVMAVYDFFRKKNYGFDAKFMVR